MFARLPTLFLLCLSILLPSQAQDQVKAELVSTAPGIAPGGALTIALRLEHAPHWHTYWINPGTGYPTSIAWDLPEGWTVGEFLWPTPSIIRDSSGAITGNGYEGVTYLPFALNAPDHVEPGTQVTLKGHADWLMCADVCIPGDAAVELTLLIVAQTPIKSGPHSESIRESLLSRGKLPPGARATATREGNTVRLHITGIDTPVENPWFFASDAFVQFDQPQTIETNANGELVVVLPVSDYYDGPGDRLVGVLRQDGIWHKQANGLIIDLPFNPGTSNPPASPGAGAGPTSLLGTLFFAWVGGLILNLMPCVFPVLGIKIMGFVQQAGEDRRKVALHGWVFTLGVLLSFWALAGLLALLRAGGEELGWGFQLQSAGFVFVLAAVMLVFALAMSGVFEFGLSAIGVGAKLQSQDGLSGSFFTGVLATIVATPCSAPFLAPALGAALTLPLGASFAVFTAVAVGLSTPYLLLSLFPGAVKVLPRPGAWMETFKQLMAFPLYAAAAFLVWVLAGQTSESGSLMVMMGLTIVALGTWLYGRWSAPRNSPGKHRNGIIGGGLVLAAGMFIGWPQAPTADALQWETWSPEAVAAAHAGGDPVYVDFTARWCATCQTNKKLVFGSAEVQAVMRERGVRLFKADWTNRDPAITAELERWGRSAVPFNLVYLPDQKDPKILPELLTPRIVLDALGD
jgi:thiol:disulfide interchange protein DsbD